jgi:hypothetical protein
LAGESGLRNVLSGFVAIFVLGCLIPFSGLGVGIALAVMFGIAFAPTVQVAKMLPRKLPLLLLEGQASILFMLAVWIVRLAVLHPSTVGHSSRSRAWIQGLRYAMAPTLVAIAILFMAALYESLVIWLEGAGP